MLTENGGVHVKNLPFFLVCGIALAAVEFIVKIHLQSTLCGWQSLSFLNRHLNCRRPSQMKTFIGLFLRACDAYGPLSSVAFTSSLEVQSTTPIMQHFKIGVGGGMVHAKFDETDLHSNLRLSQ